MVMVSIVFFTLIVTGGLVVYLAINYQKKRIQQVKGQLKKTEGAKQQIEKEFDSIKLVKARVEQELQQEKTEKKDLADDLTRESQAKEELNQQLSKIKGDLEKQKQEAERLAQELEKEKLEKTGLYEKLFQAEDEKGKLRSELEQVRLAKEILEKKVAELQEEKLRKETELAAKKQAEEEQKRREAGRQGSQIPLEHRPPRRHSGLQGPSPEQQSKEPIPRCPRPEIVCWKRERQWIPGVEVPEEFLENSGLDVFQNGSSLTQDESNEGCWRLEHTCVQVVVVWNEDDVVSETSIALGERNYLLFKLSGKNQNRGRRVKSTSFGSYIMVVPNNWNRDEVLSGDPPAAPEDASLDGYKVHFFDLEKGGAEQIAFLTPNGSFVIESNASRFELVGTRLNDACEDMGFLFGDKPPQIRALTEKKWKDVSIIVVGEEGIGKGRWRKAFSPAQDLLEQELPSEFTTRKCGWYFVGFYDTNDDLIESMDFRFVSGLKDIKILQPPALPSEDGHSNVRVEFLHEPNCTVRLTKLTKGKESTLHVEHENDRTFAIIPPDPGWDLTYWSIKSGSGAPVNLDVLIERVWWSLGEEDSPQQKWSDKPLIISHEYLRANPKGSICLWMPMLRWTRKIFLGFEQQNKREFEVGVNKRVVSVALCEFEILNRTQQALLKVWLDRNGILEGGNVICEIRSEAKDPEFPNHVDGVDPSQMRCCSTCDHARNQDSNAWCRREHWGRMSDDIFKIQKDRFICGEWQGEYYDTEGLYHET